MSDRGIPRSYRMMQGFGVNTYTLVNGSGERFFVKFHWLPELGVHSFVWDEALKICGQDPGTISIPLDSKSLPNDSHSFTQTSIARTSKRPSRMVRPLHGNLLSK